MLSVAICDDNKLQLDLLHDMIDDYLADKKLSLRMDFYQSGVDLLNDVETKGKYDIYLLDVIMPVIDGVQVGERLREMGDDGRLIFVTSATDYATASYDLDAFYYLVKPVSAEKFRTVMDKVIDSLEDTDLFTTIKTPEGERRLNVSDIVYVGYEDRSLCYHLLDGTSFFGLKVRKAFAESVAFLLELGDFTLCGSSMVLNLRHVISVSREVIKLDGDMLVYPPRTGYAATHSAWLEFISK